MPHSVLTQIARQAIHAYIYAESIDRTSYLEHYPELGNTQATFVTLTLEGELRGCIGSILAYRPLIDDLIANAQAAAFHDPRFYPLSEDELSRIRIEVSLLSEPKRVDYTDKDSLRQQIIPFRDGVILKLGSHQATFLPQVWDQLEVFEDFFAQLGIKAGIGKDPLAYHPEIYVYHVDKVKE